MLRYNSGSSDFWKKCDFNLHSVAEIVCYAYVHDICTLWIFEREKKSQKNSLSDSTFSRSISLRLERSDLHNKKKWPAIWARDQLSEWSSIVLEVRVVHCVKCPALNARVQHTTLTSWRSTFFAWLISRKQQNDSLKIEWEDAQVFILFTFPFYSLLPKDFSEFHTKQGVRIRKTGCVCCRHVQRVKKKRRMTFFHELEKNKKWKFFFFLCWESWDFFHLETKALEFFSMVDPITVMYREKAPCWLLTHGEG